MVCNAGENCLLLAFPNELQVQSCLMASFAAGLADPWKAEAASDHDECNDKHHHQNDDTACLTRLT